MKMLIGAYRQFPLRSSVADMSCREAVHMPTASWRFEIQIDHIQLYLADPRWRGHPRTGSFR